DTEVPSSHAGVLKKILANEGDVVAVGAPIATIETSGEATSNQPSTESTYNDSEKEELLAASPANTEALIADSSTPLTNSEINDDRFYSPLVLSIAKEEGITKNQLAKIPGSGK